MKNKGKTSLYMGLFQILCGFILVAMISGEKESWKYYLSSSHRSNVDTGAMIGWLIVIAGVAELIYGIVAMSAGEQETVAESKSGGYPGGAAKMNEWLEGEITKKEWDPAQHQVEWYIVKKQDGSTVKIWRHVSNPVVCKVGDRGRIRVAEGQITEFIANNQEV